MMFSSSNKPHTKIICSPLFKETLALNTIVVPLQHVSNSKPIFDKLDYLDFKQLYKT